MRSYVCSWFALLCVALLMQGCNDLSTLSPVNPCDPAYQGNKPCAWYDGGGDNSDGAVIDDNDTGTDSGYENHWGDGGYLDDAGDALDGGGDGEVLEDTDVQGEEDSGVECVCDQVSFCCDGCHAVNVGVECFHDALACTQHICSEGGLCQRVTLDGWCIDDLSLCRNTSDDPANCGECGNVCAAGLVCSDGECILNCGDGLTYCGGQCVSLDSHDWHCGGCGAECPHGTACSGGQCLVQVTGIALTPAALTLDKGSSTFLSAVVEPANAANKTVLWSSSATGVVTVDPVGRVTAVGAGQATISASAEDGGHTATSLVTVEVPVEGVAIEPALLSLMSGEATTLRLTLNPADTTVVIEDLDVVWSSENTSVVGVAGGAGPWGATSATVTAMAAGSATITASVSGMGGQWQAHCAVVVSSVAVTGVTMTPAAITLRKGQLMVLQAEVIPPDATDKRIHWESSAPHLVSVTQDGVITANGGGQATITATTINGGSSATCLVTVVVPVTGVELESTQIAMERGDTSQLLYGLLPPDATVQTVSWSSEDPTVAHVNGNGLVTAVGAGSTVITVTTGEGGYTASCVAEVRVSVSSVSIAPESLTMVPGDTHLLTVTVLPEDATDRSVTWASLSPEVATVDQQGTVTALANGSTIIKVITNDGELFAHSQISVFTPVAGLSVTPESMVLALRERGTFVAQIIPEEASNKTVEWESADPSVAVVDEQGVVTSVGMGVTIITATAVDGGSSDYGHVEVIPYRFSSHTFTTCGASGQYGPMESACRGAYEAVQSGADWAGEQEFFGVEGGIQRWMVPLTGTYRIEAFGASGGGRVDANKGKGGKAVGTVDLTAGQVIYFSVGQQGLQHSELPVFGGGGGGGLGSGDRGPMHSGGGASDVRTGGAGLNNRVLVAGGGGGGAGGGGTGDEQSTNARDGGGGGGGGYYGGGGGGEGKSNTSSAIGVGGTQISGGVGGGSGQSGNFGYGGMGGNSAYWQSTGMGFNAHGGNGGGITGANGAQTRYYPGGGGGGSSYIGGRINGETVGGVNLGDGRITITYIP